MKCIKCGAELEDVDNFCPECGELTAKGHRFFHDPSNLDILNNGKAVKLKKKFNAIISIFSLSVIIFALLMIFTGQNLMTPFGVIQKKINYYRYGYNTSLIKTNNKYNFKVNNYDEAIEFIKKDFSNQLYTCNQNKELTMLEYELESDYEIPSVVFCDMSLEEAHKIKDVIVRMYALFPNIKGNLTNITITNSKTGSDYVAYFQPAYQFVNVNKDIKENNKVNKTQILLNSYYFLNDNILSQDINEVLNNYYVEDATFESTIAHELGHYISFVAFLREKGVSNITLVTKDNEEEIKSLINEFENGEYLKNILEQALNNYNLKYNENLNLQSFAETISKYAGVKDKNGNLLYSETIAEAIHDYYLHNENAKKSSYEIVMVLKSKLKEVF